MRTRVIVNKSVCSLVKDSLYHLFFFVRRRAALMKKCLVHVRSLTLGCSHNKWNVFARDLPSNQYVAFATFWRARWLFLFYFFFGVGRANFVVIANRCHLAQIVVFLSSLELTRWSDNRRGRRSQGRRVDKAMDSQLGSPSVLDQQQPVKERKLNRVNMRNSFQLMLFKWNSLSEHKN
jgi:hypothetical protein